VSSRSGSFRGTVGSNAAYEGTNPKDVEAGIFAQELCKELKEHCIDKTEKLYIVTTPHFYGLLEKHLNCKATVEYIAKDYTKYQLPKLLAALREHLFG
jgi:protein required for attachment to host cells